MSDNLPRVPSLLDRLSQTERDIVITLKTLGECDAETVAERLRLSVSAVRASLQVLRLSGQVQIRREGHGVGRKRFYYSLSDEGQRLFPAGSARLATSLLTAVAATAPQEYRAAVESTAQKYRANAESRWRSVSPAELPGAIAGDFEEFGYLAEAQHMDDSSSFELRFFHCPYLDLVRGSTWMCDLEGQLLAQGSGGEVTRAEHQLRGDRACTYRVALDREARFAGPDAESMIP